MAGARPAMQFIRWLSGLSGRLRRLRSNIRRASVADAERELNTCNAELEHLYDYADRYSLDVSQCFSMLSEIEALLLEIQDAIEAKRQPWWRKVLGVVVGMVRIVANLFGFSGPALPWRPSPPKLPGPR